jgi:ethanolamine ammonia-lyase large subunit
VDYRHVISQRTYVFEGLKMLLARATPLRSGDVLAGVAAATYEERVAAQLTLADVYRCGTS